MDPAKIDAILQWERPKNVLKIHCFLRFIGYYRYFVENFSKIATPLTRLARKDTSLIGMTVVS